MFRKLGLAILSIGALCCCFSEVKAQHPFGFQFGTTLGYQSSFQNRLPAPPYFAIYPPVYYGKRYARPYGDSPFAAFPQLHASADYQPAPYGATYRTRSIANPHLQHGLNNSQHASPLEHRINGEPVATNDVKATSIRSSGRTVIVNPFAQLQVAANAGE